MRIVRWGRLAAAAFLVACATTDTTPLADPDLPVQTKNADGAAYPTDHIGTRDRTKLRPGDRIAAFSFQGYVDGDPEKGLTTVSLSDFYDPEQKRYKLLHIQGVASWCPICAQEARQTAAAQDALRAKGVVIVQVLFQGKDRSTGPSLADLETWCNVYEPKHPVLFDANAKRLGAFGIDGFPWNALVDTRTMEILDQGTGAPSDVTAYVNAGLELVAGPPATW